MNGAKSRGAWLERRLLDMFEKASVMRAALLLFAFVLFFARFEEDALSTNDTALHVGIARRMAEGGSWVTPTLYGRPWFEHTPLFLWATAASIKLFGFSPGAARLPGLFLAWIAVLVAFELGRLERGPIAGLIAGVVLSTTEIFWRHAGRVRMDVPLACFVAIAVLCLELAMRRHRAFFIAFGLCTGTAVFLKGPIGLAPLGALMAMLSFARPRYVRGLVLASGWFWAGVLAIVLVPLPWVTWQLIAHSGWYERYVLGQVIGLPVHGSGGVREPLFVPVMLLKTYWPWLPLVLLAGFRAIKTPRTDFFPLVSIYGWVAFILVALTISVRHADYYLIPIYPAFAVLAGHAAAVYLDVPQRRAMLVAGVLAAGLLLAVVFAVTPLSLRRDQLEKEGRSFGAIAPMIRDRLATSGDPARVRIGSFGLQRDRAAWSLVLYLDLRDEPIHLDSVPAVSAFLSECDHLVVMPDGPSPAPQARRIGAAQGLMLIGSEPCSGAESRP